MRFAVLGAGRIGSFHARTLARRPDVDSVLIGDVSSERAAELASRIGGRAVSVEDTIGEADALVIATSTSSHPELIRAGLARRVPIFCEKPLALGLTETAALVEEIEASGVPFQLGFQRRFDPGYLRAKTLIENGDVGTVYLMRMCGHGPNPPHEEYIPTSGGMFRDAAIHDFDLVRWLSGSEVSEVHAVGAVRKWEVFRKYDDYDTTAVLLRLADGSLAVVTNTRHDPLGYDIRTEILGSGDSIVVGLDGRTPIRSVEDGWSEVFSDRWDDFVTRFAGAYEAEIDNFVRVARRQATSPCLARDGLEALRIAVAADISAREGRPVAPASEPAVATDAGPVAASGS